MTATASHCDWMDAYQAAFSAKPFTWLPRVELGMVAVSGPDARRFLQNQTSNDIHTLQPGTSQESALLDRKGHVLALFTVALLANPANTYWLITEKSQTTRLVETLSRYHLLEDLSIKDISSQYQLFSLLGQQLLETTDIVSRFSEGVILAKGVGQLPGWLVALPTEKVVTNDLVSGMVCPNEEASLQVLGALGLEGLLFRYGVEVDETVLLPETALAASHVSYTKGCYIGQEVIARIKTYGNLQKSLVGILFEDSPQQVQEAITSPSCFSEKIPLKMGDEPAGHLVRLGVSPQLSGMLGWAYLKKSLQEQFLDTQQPVEMAVGDTLFRVRLVSLPLKGTPA